MKTRLLILAGAAGLLLASIPAWAHHAFAAEFDANRPIKLHGTVTQWELVNPHSWIHLDVKNADVRLSSGMYPEVQWPVRRPQPSLLVPPTTIVTTTERTFVVRVSNGVAEWVTVSRGARVGDLVEIFGPLKEGDAIVRRGTDEIRQGAKVTAQPAKAS